MKNTPRLVKGLRFDSTQVGVQGILEAEGQDVDGKHEGKSQACRAADGSTAQFGTGWKTAELRSSARCS